MYIWPGFFIQFSGKISTGFQESGCRTLSLLSSPFVQFHFKAITRNNRNNQTFIPCKTRSPPQNKFVYSLAKVGRNSKEEEEGQSWFCFAIWRQKNKTSSDVIFYFGRYIYLSSEELLLASDTLPLFEGCKVVPLSWSPPERFLLCQPYKMSQNAPAKKYKSHDYFQTSCGWTKLESEILVNILYIFLWKDSVCGWGTLSVF